MMRGKKLTALCLAAGIASSMLSGIPVSARAKTATAPEGITLTKSGLVTDKDTLDQAMRDAASSSAATAAAAEGNGGSTDTAAVVNSITVLDTDDLYYTRTDSGSSIILTAANGAVRFHNTRIGDERAVVEGKLGTAFTKAYTAPSAGGIDLYQDAESGGWILWYQFDQNDVVTAIVYQPDPAAQ